MNQTKQLYIQALLISTALFLLGQFMFVKFFESLEPGFDLVTIKVIEIHRGIKTSVLFSLVLFLIPILTLLTWRLSPIISTHKKIASGIMVLISIAVSIWIRHVEVKVFYTYLIKNNLILIKDHGASMQFVDPVNFVYYMFGGLCVGCVASFLLFRLKNSRHARP